MHARRRTWPKLAGGLPPLLLAVVLLGATAAPAAADASTARHAVAASTATWSRRTVPEPAGAFDGKLDGVACVSATDCYAVGWGSATGSVPGTLVEHLSGTTWAPEASPNPTAASDVAPQLNAVTCRTSLSCTAVGTDYTLSNTSNTLVESFDGTSWSDVASPDVAGATDSILAAVACSSKLFCMAVGSTVTDSPDVATLAERWNGTTWSIVASPSVSGALQTFLTSVACPSRRDCIAVGYALSTTSTQAIVETWNGASWTLGTPAEPAGSADNELSGIACPSATVCVAVGRTYATEDSQAAALAEQWSPSGWVLATTQAVPDVLGDFLVSVSCASTTSCTAAGEGYLDDEGDSETLVEAFADGTWSLATTPNAPDVTTSLLTGVACAPGSASCVAVGQSYTPDEDHLLAIARGTGAWKLADVTGPKSPASTYLAAVGCSSTACTAVGETYPANDFDTAAVVERWNGATWALERSAAPAGAVQTDLLGVTCPASKTCVAVGAGATATEAGAAEAVAFSEHWNGTTWTALTTPEPAGAVTDRLTAVSCESATTCSAVGYGQATVGGPETAFAARLAGATWTLETVPAPSGATATSLDGISCPAAKACVAVGSVTTAAGTAPLVEAWNGRAWSASASPALPDGDGGELLGVACPTSSSCFATGDRQLSGGAEASLGERRSGASWTLTATPDVTGAFATVLTGVACVATACTASGYSVADGGDTTLVASWSGTKWSLESSGHVAGDFAANLSGIACDGTTRCTAAGAGPDGLGQDDGLIEQN